MKSIGLSTLALCLWMATPDAARARASDRRPVDNTANRLVRQLEGRLFKSSSAKKPLSAEAALGRLSRHEKVYVSSKIGYLGRKIFPSFSRVYEAPAHETPRLRREAARRATRHIRTKITDLQSLKAWNQIEEATSAGGSQSSELPREVAQLRSFQGGVAGDVKLERYTHPADSGTEGPRWQVTTTPPTARRVDGLYKHGKMNLFSKVFGEFRIGVYEARQRLAKGKAIHVKRDRKDHTVRDFAELNELSRRLSR